MNEKQRNNGKNYSCNNKSSISQVNKESPQQCDELYKNKSVIRDDEKICGF